MKGKMCDRGLIELHLLSSISEQKLVQQFEFIFILERDVQKTQILSQVSNKCIIAYTVSKV
jgi:hypothetical protein